MLRSPITFRIRVSHQAQEPPSESLPAELGIQQGASRRSYNDHRPHQSRSQRPPTAETMITRRITELADIRSIQRQPILDGLINHPNPIFERHRLVVAGTQLFNPGPLACTDPAGSATTTTLIDLRESRATFR
jgi:hypothetical protein